MTIAELKKEITELPHIIGFDKVTKGLVNGEFSKVYVSSNCNKKEIIMNLCKLNNVKLEELDLPNKDLGVVCKKTYSISVIGINKK